MTGGEAGKGPDPRADTKSDKWAFPDSRTKPMEVNLPLTPSPNADPAAAEKSLAEQWKEQHPEG